MGGAGGSRHTAIKTPENRGCTGGRVGGTDGACAIIVSAAAPSAVRERNMAVSSVLVAVC
jgi:hypothetical protein